MKFNRFIALAAIALLVVGAMGAISMKVFAQSNVQTQNCDQQDGNNAEVEDAPDTRNVDQQCGNQNETDGQETVDTADTENANDQAGDQNEAESTDSQEAIPTGIPAITADAAQKTAEAYLNAGTATKVELDVDDQSNQLIYSVEIGGVDVKVDAMTGNVLGKEPAER